jgi:hypothetical protein
MDYSISKVENIIKQYYKKQPFNARFVYIKQEKTLYHIKVIPRRKNGFLFDIDIAILDYAKSKTDDFNLLDLILQMYDCNIEDTTDTVKIFDLTDKFVPDISTNLTITFCNNKFQSISEGFIII